MRERRDERTTGERRAAQAVRSVTPPQPGQEYRARLKRGFVEGTLAPPMPGPRIVSPALDRQRPAWTGLLLPAAAGFLVVVGLLINRGPGWRVVEVSGAGPAEVNGRAIELAEVAALDRALGGGAHLKLPAGASLVLEAPGRMAVEITPETEATLGAPPGRWLGRIAWAELSSGVLRVATAAGFHGLRLTVLTPEARVEVAGTTLAVIREPDGTCVCVMEGVVRVGAHGHEMVSVPARERRFVFHDGRPPEQAEMRPEERVKLGEMRHQHGR